MEEVKERYREEWIIPLLLSFLYLFYKFLINKLVEIVGPVNLWKRGSRHLHSIGEPVNAGQQAL